MLTPMMKLIALSSRFITRPPETVPLAQARAGMRKATRGPRFILGGPVPLPTVVDERVAGVPVRRYAPERPKPGTLAYFHGGGWVTGDLETHDGVCRVLARDLEREVVAVDYRLAPEHPGPAAADDCEAVTRALLERGPVAVAGDSAGGNLAAVVANRLGASKTPLAAQALVYPVTDCATEHPSIAQFATGYFLSRETMRFFHRQYAPDEARRRDPDLSPLYAPSLAGVAPAYVLLAECDVLRDEGRAYAKRLRDDGVDVTLDEVPGHLHGFLNMQGLGSARAAMGRLVVWLDARFGAAAR